MTVAAIKTPNATIPAVAPRHVKAIATKLTVVAVILAGFGTAESTLIVVVIVTGGAITATTAAIITITQHTISGRVPSWLAYPGCLPSSVRNPRK